MWAIIGSFHMVDMWAIIGLLHTSVLLQCPVSVTSVGVPLPEPASIWYGGSLQLLPNITDTKVTVMFTSVQELSADCDSDSDLGGPAGYPFVQCPGQTDAVARCTEFNQQERWSRYDGVATVDRACLTGSVGKEEPMAGARVSPAGDTLEFSACCWPPGANMQRVHLSASLLVVPEPPTCERAVFEGQTFSLPSGLFRTHCDSMLKVNIMTSELNPDYQGCLFSDGLYNAGQLNLEDACVLTFNPQGQIDGSYLRAMSSHDDLCVNGSKVVGEGDYQFVFTIDRTPSSAVQLSPNDTASDSNPPILKVVFDQDIRPASDSVITFTGIENNQIYYQIFTSKTADQVTYVDSRTVEIKPGFDFSTIQDSTRMLVTFTAGLAQSCSGLTAPLDSTAVWTLLLDGLTSIGIQKLSPAYGPLAGGTRVTLTGLFVPRVSIHFGKKLCNVIESQTQSIICVTSSAAPEDVGKALIASVTLADSGQMKVSQQHFTYRPDPVLRSVDPLATIVSGGTSLTVTGEWLNSVAHPVMDIHVVFRAVSDHFKSRPCQVKNANIMICQTPLITLPEVGLKERRKRNVKLRKSRFLWGLRLLTKGYGGPGLDPLNNLTWRETGSQLGQRKPWMTSHRRHERQASGSDGKVIVNHENPDVTFELSFRMDGVTTAVPGFSQIDVFYDPVLYPFEKAGKVRIFRPFALFNDRVLDIKGKRLQLGDLSSQYRVGIGHGTCSSISVTTTRLTCFPPTTRPERLTGDWYQRVTVSIGSLSFHVGFLEYQQNFWEYPGTRYGTLLGCLVFFAAVILVIYLVWKRSKRTSRQRASTSSGRRQSAASAGAYARKLPVSPRISNVLSGSHGPDARWYRENKDMPLRYSQALEDIRQFGSVQEETLSRAPPVDNVVYDMHLPELEKRPSVVQVTAGLPRTANL